MRHPLRPRRRLLPAGQCLARLAPVLAALLLLRQVLALEMLAELAPVNLGPLLVERPVLAPVKVELAPVLLPGRDHRVDVYVAAVSVDRVNDVGFRQALPLVVGDHLPDLLVARVIVEGVDEPVEGPDFTLLPAAGLSRLRQLVLFELADELGEVGAPLFVRDGPAAVDVLGDVLRPHPLVLAACGDDAGVVERPAAALARGAHGRR